MQTASNVSRLDRVQSQIGSSQARCIYLHRCLPFSPCIFRYRKVHCQMQQQQQSPLGRPDRSVDQLQLGLSHTPSSSGNNPNLQLPAVVCPTSEVRARLHVQIVGGHGSNGFLAYPTLGHRVARLL